MNLCRATVELPTSGDIVERELELLAEGESVGVLAVTVETMTAIQALTDGQ